MDRSTLKEQIRKYVIEYKHSLGAFDLDSINEYDTYINHQQRLLLKRIERATKATISKIGEMTVEQYQKLLAIARELLDEHQIKITTA